MIDIRTLYIESDDEIVDRIHKVLEHIDPEQVYLSTDCGLKALPRFCAYEKLRALPAPPRACAPRSAAEGTARQGLACSRPPVTSGRVAPGTRHRAGAGCNHRVPGAPSPDDPRRDHADRRG